MLLGDSLSGWKSLLFLIMAAGMVFYGAAGCARLGERMERVELPPGAPSVEEILSGLSENEQALRDILENPTIKLETDELDSSLGSPAPSYCSLQNSNPRRFPGKV